MHVMRFVMYTSLHLKIILATLFQAFYAWASQRFLKRLVHSHYWCSPRNVALIIFYYDYGDPFGVHISEFTKRSRWKVHHILKSGKIRFIHVLTEPVSGQSWFLELELCLWTSLT